MRSLFTCFVCLALAGCATPTGHPRHGGDGDRAIDRAVEIVKRGGELNYETLRQLYLQSYQIGNIAEANELYTEQAAAIASGAMSCSDYRPELITGLNVFALGAHMLAIECYSELGKTEAAQAHQNILQFILTGILGNKAGETYYDAYEVAAWSEANDILALAGFEIIDSWFSLGANRAAFYRVYLVWDPQEELYREIYFDNQRFIHAVIGGTYPFSGVNDIIYENVILATAHLDPAAQLAEAMVLEDAQQYGEAEAAYLKAIEMGSVKANVELGKLCLAGRSARFALEECAQLFVAAVEQGVESAKVYLAYMAYVGHGMDADADLAERMLASIKGLKPGEAEYLMASVFSSSSQTAADSGLAGEFLMAAVEADHADALFYYAGRQAGLVRSRNDRAEQNFYKAMRRAADQDHPPALHRLGALELRFGEDKAAGLALLEEAARRHLPDALYELGNVYEFGIGGIPTDLARAREYYEAAAMKWQLQAQFRLGVLHTYGKGTAIDFDLANAWYYTCAWPGNLDCITNMGVMHEKGWGVDKDAARAAELYQIASDHGLPRATYNLGYFHQQGIGVEQDLSTAYLLYERAADEGDAWAKTALARWYIEGTAVEQDYNKAFKLLSDATASGPADAFYFLGLLFERGWGVAQDEDKAKSYFEQAKRLGFEAPASM